MRARKTFPASVRWLPRFERWMSVTPSALSRFFICALKADCVMFASLAARVKFCTRP